MLSDGSIDCHRYGACMSGWDNVESRDGTRIAFQTAGDGPHILIVHGSVSNGSDWEEVATRLSRRFTVHIMTRRGVGRSSDGPRYALEHEYDDIVAVLNATAAQRLVGHSFGAICALGAALIVERLDRLVLYEPPLNIHTPVVTDDALSKIHWADRRGDVAAVVEIGLRRCVRMPTADVDAMKGTPVWSELVRDGRRWARELQAIHDLPSGAGRYATITTPTLLVVGEETQPHHRDAAEALATVLPHAEIVELPEVGHDANLIIPEVLARDLAHFLS